MLDTKTSESNTKIVSEKMSNEKEDSDVEEMDHESEESEASNSVSGGESSDTSDSDEASELDEEYVRRRQICLSKMYELEKQYMELHDVIINERLKQISLKLTEIQSGEAPEYLQPLAELEDNMRIRLEVAGVLRKLRLKNLDNQYEAEEMTAKQNFENEKCLLFDAIEDDLKDKMKRLEEDRNNVDINADLWLVERGLVKAGKVKDKKQNTSAKGGASRNSDSTPRRKPVTVTGPYIVYMLRDSEILEDWTVIKKALSNCNRKSSCDYYR